MELHTLSAPVPSSRPLEALEALEAPAESTVVVEDQARSPVPVPVPQQVPTTPIFIVREAHEEPRLPSGTAWLREVLPGGDPVLVAPTGIAGLDRLLHGGLRLCQKLDAALTPSMVIRISGPAGAGKTTLGLHLAAALCRAHGRGAALYLCPEGELRLCRALLGGYDEAGFAWVSTERSRALPAVATGVVLAPAGGVIPPAAADGAEADGPALLCRVEQLLRQFPRELPVRVVVVDDPLSASSGAPQGTAALAERLAQAGVSLIVVERAGPDADRGAGPAGGPGADWTLSSAVDLAIGLANFDPETGGRSLRVTSARLSPAVTVPSLLSFSDGTVRVMPPASLYPALCLPPPAALRALPAGRFGDPTLDKRAGDRPWLTPQCRVLLYGPDPTSTLLLCNRFLAEAPQRLALFFSAPAARAPATGERGIVHVRRARSGAEVVAQVAEALTAFRTRWPRILTHAPRVALIDPGGLYDDGRHDSAPAVLDAALLSLCAEAGVMALVCRTGDDLCPWWSDYDLVLHLPARPQGGALTVRVVTDRVAF